MINKLHLSEGLETLEVLLLQKLRTRTGNMKLRVTSLESNENPSIDHTVIKGLPQSHNEHNGSPVGHNLKRNLRNNAQCYHVIESCEEMHVK